VFQTLLARESTGLGPRPLAFPDGSLAGEVEAVAPPDVKREAANWAIAVPIGAEAPISCFVFDKAIDAASTLVRFIRLAKERAKGITVQAVAPTDVGVIGETAYVMAALTYTVPSPKGLLGGQVKLMVRPDADVPLLCFHDEVGYASTFKRVTVGLARSVKARRPSPPAQFVEIQVSHLGDVPIGFERRTINTDAHGIKYDQTISCQLLPRSALDMAGTDRVETERSDATGRLIQLDSVEVEGEEIESQFHLARQGVGREYTLKGKQSGKDVTARFKSREKDGLPSSLLVASRLRASLLGGKPAEVRVEEYHPGLAPQPFEVVYRSKDGGAAVTMMLGQLEATGRLDDRGMVEQVSMPIGAVVMRQERAFVRGTP